MSFPGTRSPLKPTGKARWQVPMRRHGGTGPLEYYLEGEIEEKFRRLYPVHSVRRVMQWFGISFSTAHRLARGLGLGKDMRAVRRERARDARRTCERSGYYASLRGKPPSEACLEATRRKRAEGFNPMLALREGDPRKYRRMLEHRGEARRELFRKERLRELYGLERKTRLRVTRTLTSGARGQKHNMIRKRNYYADPDHPSWVCYDGETDRSPRMEATAARHGLRVVDGGQE